MKDITDVLAPLATLFAGGGIMQWVNVKSTKKRAAAEAESAEIDVDVRLSEAAKASVETMKLVLNDLSAAYAAAHNELVLLRRELAEERAARALVETRVRELESALAKLEG